LEEVRIWSDFLVVEHSVTDLLNNPVKQGFSAVVALNEWTSLLLYERDVCWESTSSSSY
jgi:hypothetical protein